MCQTLTVITEYRREKPAKILGVICEEHNKAFPKLIELFQNREDEIFRFLGNKSPVVFFDDRTEYVKTKKLLDKKSLEIKEGIKI